MNDSSSLTKITLKKVIGNMALHSTRICSHMKSILQSVNNEENDIFIRNEVLRLYDILNKKQIILIKF